MRTVIRMLVSAFALWLTTLIVGGDGPHGVWVESPTDARLADVPVLSDVTVDGAEWSYIATLVLIALLFGLVNGTLGKVVRVVSIPLYILTLGLFAFIVNGILFAVVAWLSDLAGFGLRLDGFWWGVLGATIMSLIASLLNALLGTGKRRRKSS